MSEADVEILREGFARLSVDGFESMVVQVHPDFEMTTPAGMAAEPQTYHGRDGFRRWWTSFYEVMTEVRLVPVEFHDVAPERVVIELEMRARGQASGIETSRCVFLAIQLENGLMRRIELYETLGEAVERARR